MDEKERIEFTVGYFAAPPRKVDIREHLLPYLATLELEVFPRNIIDFEYESEDRLFPKSNIEYLQWEKRRAKKLVKSSNEVIQNLDMWHINDSKKVKVYKLIISLELVEEKEIPK